MNKMESIGYRIRRVRALTGLSQEEFAAQVGVSRSVLSQIEIDKIRPSLDVLSAISKLYNTPYNWLIEGGPAPNELKDLGYPSKEIKGKPDDWNDADAKSRAFSKRPPIMAQAKITNAVRSSMDDRMSNLTRSFVEFAIKDGKIWLVTEHMFDNYLHLSKRDLLEEIAEEIKLPASSLKQRYQYRAFEVPDNRMAPLLERNDILIGYQQNNPRDLVLLSLYILVLERNILFGVLTGITDTHYLISHNPVNDYQVEYSKDEIKEFWLVDKVLNDNFTSRFRQAQMMMMQANPMARNIQKGNDKGI
jgi:transcriptional regulator with XRE-family HTH domain